MEALQHAALRPTQAHLEQSAALPRDKQRQKRRQDPGVAIHGRAPPSGSGVGHDASVASGVRWAMNQNSPSTSSTSCG